MNRKKITKCILLVFVVYVFSYFLLSRSSMYLNKRIYPDWDNSFFYVPCDSIHFKDNTALQCLHVGLVYFYYPVWFFDHYVLRGPNPSHFPEDLGLFNADPNK
jgi:hypothetical protein